MHTLIDTAQNFGLKLSTLRYWLRRNTEDCENGYYETNLMNLTQRILIKKQTASKRNIVRGYSQIIILDLEEFKTEFFKYVDYIEGSRNRKRDGNSYWTYTALECYSCSMNCKKCFNKEICNKVLPQNGEPPMKNVVKKLLKTIGKPNIQQIYN